MMFQRARDSVVPQDVNERLLAAHEQARTAIFLPFPERNLISSPEFKTKGRKGKPFCFFGSLSNFLLFTCQPFKESDTTLVNSLRPQTQIPHV